MNHLEYFLESTGGAQIVDKSDNYTAYFISSFEGMCNIEMNDPYWCSTNPLSFTNMVSSGFSFIRYRFNSGFKIRFTISSEGLYDFAIGGWDKKTKERIVPIEFSPISKKISYLEAKESIHRSYSKVDNIDFILSEFGKINYSKLNLLIDRIVGNKWNSLINRDIKNNSKLEFPHFIHTPTEIEFKIRKISELDNFLDCKLYYDQNEYDVITALRSLKSKNGVMDQNFKHNIRLNTRLVTLNIRFDNFTLSDDKIDKFVSDLKSINIFSDVLFENDKIRCEFKNFVLKVKY